MCEAIKGIREDVRQEGIAQGITQGIAQNQRDVTFRMAEQGIAVSIIAKSVNVAESVIECWLSEAATAVH